MTTKRARTVSEELAALYRPGLDNLWCSDYEGKERFCAAVGIPFRYGDDHDFMLKRLLRTLPHPIRWVMEMRTGLWSGDVYASEWRPIAERIAVPVSDAELLFRGGVAMVRLEARRLHIELDPANERSSRQFSNTGSEWQRQRFAVLKRDGYRCQMCGRNAADGVRLEVDHRIPVVAGGSGRLDNLWTLCLDCNRGKGTEEL